MLRCCVGHRDLPSFPTRRSSDLDGAPDAAHEADDAVVLAGLRPVRDRHEVDDLADAVGREEPCQEDVGVRQVHLAPPDRKSTRLNSSHLGISYAVFCLKKKIKTA